MASITKRSGNCKLYSYSMLIFLFCMIFVNAFSCDSSDDDDDGDENGDDDSSNWDSDPECEANHQPIIENVKLIVNNSEVSMPIQILVSDQVEVELDYEDEDCNLEGGHLYVSLNSQDGSSLMELLNQMDLTEEEKEEYINRSINWYTFENIGCSSEEAGAPYRFALNPMDYLFPEEFQRQKPFEMGFEDSCESGADEDIVLDFTVVENK